MGQYQQYDKWGDVGKKLQEPMQAMAELNMKTFQSLSYLKPDDLVKLKKPEDLIQQQLQITIENGHKALDYLQRSFEIIEKAMLSGWAETKRTAEKAEDLVKK